MKQSQEKEMDRFAAYLFGHLRDHRFSRGNRYKVYQ